MISFFNLEAQQELIKEQIDKNISRVLQHGQYILGPEVITLEEKLADYTGAKFCITCANGTDALQVALMGIGIQANDEVIVPNFSYIATAEAIALLGAKPVFVDVNKQTCNLDPLKIEEHITVNTKAIIAVSLYGRPADFDAINQIAERNNLVVIEDAAQSFGASYNHQKSCNLSTIACTSFFPTKPLGCYGDGGAIFTSDPEIAKTARMIARHGQSKRYHHELIGVNSRLDTIQAAVLLAKIDVLDQEIATKQQFANLYTSKFAKYDIRTPPELHGYNSAWAQYTIQISDRERVQKKLMEAQIPTAIHYPMPLSNQTAFADKNTDTPVSKILAKEVLSLPMNAYLSKDNIDDITGKILSSFD